MEFKQLEAFAAVMEYRSFSRAAEALFLTQPTVSAHVAMLERELGTMLLRRTTRELSPTEAGEVFYEYAKNLLALRDEACSAVTAAAGAGRCITVAASTVPEKSYLPQLIAAYKVLHPDAAFEVLTGDSRDVETMLCSGKAELGFMGRRPTSTRCIHTPFAEDSLIIITPNNERFSRLAGSAFPLPLLLMEPYVTREPGSGTRAEVEAFLSENGIDPGRLNIAAETGSTGSVLKLVSEGVGVSIVSSAAAADMVEYGSVLSFPPEHSSPSRLLYVARLRSSVLSAPAKSFLDFVREHSGNI